MLSQARFWLALSTLFLLFLLGAQGSNAQWMSQNLIWDRAKPLEVGRQYMGIQFRPRSYQQKFTADGRRQALGKKYEQKITWGELREGEVGKLSKSQINSYMKESKLSPNTPAIINSFDIKRDVYELKPFWCFGFTENWSIISRIPIAFSKTIINTTSQPTNDLRAFYKKIESNNGDSREKGSFKLNEDELANYRLEQKGYRPIEREEERVDLGDVEIENKFLIFDNQSVAIALQQQIQIPSAKPKEINQYIDTSYSGGGYGLGAGAIVDWRINGLFNISSQLKHMVQLRDKVRLKVDALPGNDSETSDITFKRDLGDLTEAKLLMEWKVRQNWRVTGGYTRFHKEKDQYENKDINSENIERFEVESDKSLHQASLGFSYLPEKFFSLGLLDKSFSAHLNLTTDLGGTNIETGPFTTLEVMLVF